MWMVALLCGAFAAPAGAASAEAEGLQRCKAFAVPEERLACYDKLGGFVPADPSSARLPVAPAAAAAQDPATFGLENRDATKRIDEIESTITGAFEGWGPRALISLDNGQVWQIVDGSQAVYRLQSPRVKIVRGIARSFFMHVDGVGPTPRVRRVR